MKIIEIKYTINIMHLNHPETNSTPTPTPPYPSMEKSSTMKQVPDAKKVGPPVS